MTAGELKAVLAAGETAVGVMAFELGTPGIARIAEAAGADFVLLDQEHTGWSLEAVRRAIAAGRGCGVVPLVRVPAAEYHLVAGALDAGAAGVMVPMVESADQARLAVEWSTYPPLGHRGFGALYDDQYVQGDVAATIEQANAEVIVIAQVETVAGIGHVEAIAAVDGIDVVWIGPYDLSISLRVPGEFDDSVYVEAVERLLDAARTAGKAAGVAVGSVEEGAAELARGFRCLAFSDIALFQQALREGIDALRGHTDAETRREGWTPKIATDGS